MVRVETGHQHLARASHYGDAVRSKSDTAMVNEVLCKVLAHNLCVLNQEECELGIEAMFSNPEEKVLPLADSPTQDTS